ncbi:SRPBCC domain-containing protein [Agrococcus beijingensis]|uniref:SRPBCC domain-containing protein n=1 Tax=Agrococcus beijingensis TaxID=3068634 RepID=UPI00274067EA|nr:SRPBCC domain-containing protein [Agrococcus sp. REN33]
MQTRFSLPDDTSIAYEREFRAPASEVWQAYTDPEIVRTWMLGPNPDTAFLVCEMDIRPGGSFRWQWVDDDGELEIWGDVLEAEEPRRMVTTEHMGGSAMGGMELPPSTSTVTFDEHDGVTTMRTVIVYDSKETRDGAYASGMDEGIEAGFLRRASRGG